MHVIVNHIISFSLNAYSSYSGVYYCSDEKVTGFQPKDSFKTILFEEERFKIQIDYEMPSVYSSEPYLGSMMECKVNKYSSILCFSYNGPSFTFNPESRYFVRSQHFADDEKPRDSIYKYHCNLCYMHIKILQQLNLLIFS